MDKKAHTTLISQPIINCLEKWYEFLVTAVLEVEIKTNHDLLTWVFPWMMPRTCIIIIQQIVTMPIYGKEALNICHPT